MNWEAIAAVAELLGAVGVIASLIYLARQLRSTGSQARQAALQSVVNQMNGYWTQMASERSISEVFARGSKGLSHLESEADKLQFSAVMFSIFRPYEEIFHYRNNGMVEDWTWESISGQCHALMGTQGFAEWWAQRGDWFSKAFREHITATLGTIPAYRGWTDGNRTEPPAG